MKMEFFSYPGVMLNRKSIRAVAVIMLAAIVSGIFYDIFSVPGIFSNASRDGVKENPVSSIDIVTAGSREVEDTIEVPGQIVFNEKINISSKVNGRLKSIKVREGSHVRKGELIAEIERLPFEITLKQQRSELEIAKKALELAMAKYSDALKGIEIKFKNIRKAEAELNDRRVSYEHMNSILKNKSELFKAGGISASELKSIKTEHTTLLTRYELAKSDYEIQLVGYRDQDIINEGIKIPSTLKEKIEIYKLINTKIERAEVESSKSRLNQARSSLLSTELLLKETYIKSPINGVVAVKNMEGGEMVKDDSVIAVVIDIDRVFISLNVNEKDIQRVKKGNNVKFTVDAFNGDRVFHSKIDIISPVLDGKTRSIEVKAEVINKKHSLLPGMFARAVIETGVKTSGVFVPKRALVVRHDGKGEIFKIKNGMVVKELVVTGVESGSDIGIVEGVSEGDRVIVSGLNRVYQGMKIER